MAANIFQNLLGGLSSPQGGDVSAQPRNAVAASKPNFFTDLMGKIAGAGQQAEKTIGGIGSSFLSGLSTIPGTEPQNVPTDIPQKLAFGAGVLTAPIPGMDIPGGGAEAAGERILGKAAGKVAEPLTELGGKAFRRFFLETRNLDIGAANQVAESVTKLLPNAVDRSALSFFREFKNNPDLVKEAEGLVASGDKAIADHAPAITRAIEAVKNPAGDKITEADKLLEDFFGKRLDIGKQLGYIKGNISDYITHVVQQGEDSVGFHDVTPASSVAKSTPFGGGRIYADMIKLLQGGKQLATTDAADIVKIYGQRDAYAHATTQLIDSLQKSGVGAWHAVDNIPKEWTNLSKYSRIFEKNIPFSTTEAGGEAGAGINRVAFTVPKTIGDALKPILEPNFLQGISPVRRVRFMQAYVKHIELSLSLFHVWALTKEAMASNNIVNGVKMFGKALGAEFTDPAFQAAERDLLSKGGMSPILGQEQEAFRKLMISDVTKNPILNNPLIRTFDALASKTTGLTFGRIQRYFKVMDYSTKNARWLAQHPGATVEEAQAAGEKIARYVNGAYGGLNWEDLGVSKSGQTLLRALLLAPDWTIANIIMPLGLLRPKDFGAVPVGDTAKFFANAIVNGIVLTQATNILLNGEPDSPYEVTLAKRKDGSKIKSVMFYPGTMKDIVSFMINPTSTLTAKLAPGLKSVAEVIVNRDYYGNTIIPPGASGPEEVLRAGEHIIGGTIPVPFSISSPLQQLQKGKGETTPQEFITGLLGIGTMRKDDPRQKLFNDLKAASIRAGKSDFQATMDAIRATMYKSSRGVGRGGARGAKGVSR